MKGGTLPEESSRRESGSSWVGSTIKGRDWWAEGCLCPRTGCPEVLLSQNLIRRPLTHLEGGRRCPKL